MDRATIRAFSDELVKIALEGHPDPAEKANALFGLPLRKKKGLGERREEGSEAQSGRPHAQLGGDDQPSLDLAEKVTNPSSGPGGV